MDFGTYNVSGGDEEFGSTTDKRSILFMSKMETDSLNADVLIM